MASGSQPARPRDPRQASNTGRTPRQRQVRQVQSIWDRTAELRLDLFTAGLQMLHDEQDFVAGNSAHVDAINAATPASGSTSIRATHQPTLLADDRNWEIRADSDENDDTLRDDPGQEDVNSLLDRIACLFAPVRRIDPETARQFGDETLAYHSPGGHVAAAAMVRDGQQIQIFVTKNRGFREEDKDFGAFIEKWLNSPAAKADTLFQYIMETTWQRTASYLCTLRALRGNWDRYCAEINGQANGQLDEWLSPIKESVDGLFSSCAELHPSSEWSSVERTIRTAFDIRSKGYLSQQRISEILTRSQPSGANITRLLKHRRHFFNSLSRIIGFLGRPVAIADTLGRWQVKTAPENASFAFRLHLLDPPRVKQPNLNQVLQYVSAWPNYVSEKEPAVQRLQTLRRQNQGESIIMHCEMQLLVYFDANPNLQPHVYIGVSKKSCWNCDNFFRHYAKFRTVGSHGHIEGFWAVDSYSGSAQLIEAIKSMQRQINSAMTTLALASVLKALPTPSLSLPMPYEAGIVAAAARLAAQLRPEYPGVPMSTVGVVTAREESVVASDVATVDSSTARTTTVLSWIPNPHQTLTSAQAIILPEDGSAARIQQIPLLGVRMNYQVEFEPLIIFTGDRLDEYPVPADPYSTSTEASWMLAEEWCIETYFLYHPVSQSMLCVALVFLSQTPQSRSHNRYVQSLASTRPEQESDIPYGDIYLFPIDVSSGVVEKLDINHDEWSSGMIQQALEFATQGESIASTTIQSKEEWLKLTRDRKEGLELLGVKM